jgi:hypothetical protein
MWAIDAHARAREGNPGARAREEFQKRMEEFENRRAATAWRGLSYALPDGYGHLDKLDLSDEQKKALGDIYNEWNAKRKKARSEALKNLPKLSAEDRRDAKKIKEHYEKREEVLKEANVPAPLDAVRGALKPDQLEKLEAAARAEQKWAKWIREELPKFEKRLNQAVGAEPDKGTRTNSYMLRRLASILPGATLIPRLGLDEDTTRKLLDIARSGHRRVSREARRAEYELRKMQRLDPDYGRTVGHALVVGREADSNKEKLAEISKLLSAEQQAKLAKGAAILRERNTAIWERFAVRRAALEKALPSAKSAATAANPAKPAETPVEAVHAIRAWSEWLESELPKFDQKLDKTVGPEPAGLTSAERDIVRRVDRYLKHGELLGRLGLSAKQLFELKQLAGTRYATTSHRMSELRRMQSAGLIDREAANLLQSGLSEKLSEERHDAVRERIKQILTDEQWSRYEAGAKIIDERTKAIWERYIAAVKAVRFALPELEEKDEPGKKHSEKHGHRGRNR